MNFILQEMARGTERLHIQMSKIEPLFQVMEPTLLMRKARLSKSLSHRLELGKFLHSRRLTQLVESRSLVTDERTGATQDCQFQRI